MGYFSSASRLTDALNLLGDAAMLSVYPLFVRYATARPDALRALAELTAKLLGVILLCVILVLSQTASDVMARLFRPEFAIAGPVLAVLSWSALLAALGNVYAHLLVAADVGGAVPRQLRRGDLQVLLQLVLIRPAGSGRGVRGRPDGGGQPRDAVRAARDAYLRSRGVRAAPG